MHKYKIGLIIIALLVIICGCVEATNNKQEAPDMVLLSNGPGPYVWHDNIRCATCYTYDASISCIPDIYLQGV